MFRFIPFVFAVCAISAFGQPVIQTGILPQVGDSVSLASDNLPEGIAITGKGANQEWDFTGLQSAFVKKIEIKSASKAFENADIMVENVDGSTSFYKLSKNQLELLGKEGTAPLNLGLDAKVYFESPLQELKAPLKYGMTYEANGHFSFTVAADDLSEDDLYALPVIPDSIRYKCFITRKSEMDAWGILSLPDNTYEVLREKQTEERELRLEIKIGELPWQDISGAVRDDRFRNKQLHQLYYFYSNETIFPIATAHLKSDGIHAEAISYIVTDPDFNMRTASGRPDIYVYPNPAINEVRFEFTHLKPSVYSLKIYNILGVSVFKNDYKVNGSKNN